jgi:hypothetical protein
MKTLLLLLILFPINVYSQDWVFVEPEDNLIKSVVAITGFEIIDRKPNRPGVTGVIVEKTNKEWKGNSDYVLGKILTCEHAPKKELEIVFFNGKKSRASVIKMDKEADLMLLSAYIHKDANAVEVYDEDNPFGVIYGLGGKYGLIPDRNNLRVFIGNRVGPKTNNYYIDARPIPGDSGGPIFCEGKICGIVSGGNRWFKREDNKGSFTWPLRTATPQSIRKFLYE